MASKHIEGLAVEIAFLNNESLYQLARELVARYNTRADYLDMMIRTECQEQLIAGNEHPAHKDKVAWVLQKN